MEKAIEAFQIPASFISVVASSTMATMILRSEHQLNKPFRRIIFFLSVSDIMNSGALMLAPFMTPGNMSGIGNQITCDLQVIFFVVGGFLGVIGYMFGLCLYFLCVVRYNYTDAQFTKRVERYIHTGIIISAIVIIAVAYFFKASNPFPDKTMCYIVDYPFGCHTDDNVECIRGKYAHLHGYFLILLPVGCVFLGMVSTLGLLCWTVYSQERRLNARLRSSFRTGSNINTSALRSSQRPQRRPTLGQRTARKRSCETMIQASLYVGVYVLTYIGPTVCLSTFYYQGVGPPRILSVVVHTIYPMGGALNILVYTRPRVSTVRKRKQEYSWCQAFWEVVKAGGEVPANCNRTSISLNNARTREREESPGDDEENQP